MVLIYWLDSKQPEVLQAEVKKHENLEKANLEHCEIRYFSDIDEARRRFEIDYKNVVVIITSWLGGNAMPWVREACAHVKKTSVACGSAHLDRPLCCLCTQLTSQQLESMTILSDGVEAPAKIYDVYDVVVPSDKASLRCRLLDQISLWLRLSKRICWQPQAAVEAKAQTGSQPSVGAAVKDAAEAEAGISKPTGPLAPHWQECICPTNGAWYSYNGPHGEWYVGRKVDGTFGEVTRAPSY